MNFDTQKLIVASTDLDDDGSVKNEPGTNLDGASMVSGGAGSDIIPVPTFAFENKKQAVKTITELCKHLYTVLDINDRMVGHSFCNLLGVK